MIDYTQTVRRFGRLLLLVALTLTTGINCLPATCANSTVSAKQALTSKVTLQKSTSLKSGAKRSSAGRQVVIPSWWRQEWTRRQQAMGIERWQLAKERQTDSKAMWNPRTPQSLAYRHALLASHGESVPGYRPARPQTPSTQMPVTSRTKSVNAKNRAK